MGDVDGDGREDLYIGGATGQAGEIFLQNQNGRFIRSRKQPFGEHENMEDVGAAFFDADGDNDLDLYVVSGSNEFPTMSPNLRDRFYLNDGNGTFTSSSASIPEIAHSGSCVVPGDYDGDGDIDLFIGGRGIPTQYPFPAKSFLLENNNGKFTDVTQRDAPDFEQLGLVNSAIWTDFDSDGSLDLMITGEWMPLKMYRNNGGKFEDMTSNYGMDKKIGWWNKLVAADMDGDGDMDYIAGNLGWNYKYKASNEEPFHIYANDFDGNGSNDIVLAYYNFGEYYPVRGLQCSSQQMPLLKNKYPTYHSFGKATLRDIYGEKLDNALHYEATWFASSYIENQGDGNFRITPLPREAQFSTVFGIIPYDFDNDGKMDLLIAGNFYVSEIETGRADASIGLFLKGRGNGEFVPVSVTESGFYAYKDVRDIQLVESADGSKMVIVANNNDYLQVFKIVPSAKGIVLGN